MFNVMFTLHAAVHTDTPAEVFINCFVVTVKNNAGAKFSMTAVTHDKISWSESRHKNTSDLIVVTGVTGVTTTFKVGGYIYKKRVYFYILM